MPPIGNKIKLQENRSLLENPRVKAMLNTIAYAEGADYNTRVGGGTFGDLSKKPGKKTYIKSIGNYSTAEGRYQFLNSTWDSVAKDLGLSDFSPQSQDLAAVELIKRRGALDDVLKGDLKSATSKLSKEWASLPTKSGGSAYGGQRARSMQSLANIFAGNGGGSTYTSQPSSSYDASTYVPEYINLSERIHGNVASTTDEDTKEEAEAKQSIDKVTQEQQMLQDYFAQNTQVAQSIPQEEQIQAYEAPTIGEQYQQVSQLVDNPIAQEGATVQGEKQWLQNWYKNRQLPDPDLNRIYQGEKDLYVKQSQNIPNPTYVDKVDDEGSLGFYNRDTKGIDMLKSAAPLVYTHEGTHAVNIPLKDTQSNVKAFSIIGENILPEEKIQNKWVKDNYKQISNYQEVIPRLNSYRQLHDLKPDQVITPELIEQNRALYKEGKIPYEANTDQLYKMFENEGLSNVLNKVVSNSKPTDNNYAQEGGEFIKDNMGQWKYPGQNTEISSPNITMRNVEYPVLGISKETGEQKMMYPEQEYFFKNTKNVLEIPQLKNYFNKN